MSTRFNTGALILLVCGFGGVQTALGQTNPQPRVEIAGFYWKSTLTGDALVSKDGVGTDVDLKKDLGLVDKKTPDGRITFMVGRNNRFRFSYAKISSRGDHLMTRDVVFAGKSYPVGAQVKSTLNASYYRFGWTWQFLNSPDGNVRFGTIVELKGLSFDTSLKSTTINPPINESWDYSAVVPTVGLVLDLNPKGPVSFYAEASGLELSKYGKFIDAEAGFRVLMLRNLLLVGCYRHLQLEAKDKPDFVNLKLKGPFLGLTLQF